jgi:phosphodiesterase/alkaline phosphatase D-like protein
MTLTLGPILGAVSHDAARIWFLAEHPGDVLVHVFLESGAEIAGSPFRPASLDSWSGTATAQARLPAPGARYRYDLRDAAGRSLLPPGLGRPGFRSAPAPAGGAGCRFALISCNDMRRADEAPWRTLGRAIEREGLDLLLCVGDQVYLDDEWRRHVRDGTAFPPSTRRAFEAGYTAQWRWPALRRTLAAVPTYMIWDDHEIRNGWGSLRADAAVAKRQQGFALAREVYWRFQHEHNPPSFCCPDQDLFYAFRHGAVGFLVLDLRGARDAARRRDALLGTHQWAAVTRWLDGELPGLRALFVVASVPPIHVRALAFLPSDWLPSDLQDQWTAPPFRAELRRLVEALLRFGNARDLPVVLLCGDAHVGTAVAIRSARAEHAARPQLLQLTASPLTSPPFARFVTRPPRWFRRVPVAKGIEGEILDWLPERNFGVIEVEVAEERAGITLRLVDERGATRVHHTLGQAEKR